jgi:hypothetical protein
MNELAGERLRGAADVDVFFQEEERLGLADRFRQLDAILVDAVAAALRGQRILDIAVRRSGPSIVKLATLSGEQRTWLNAGLSKAAHEPRGSWYLPDVITVNTGPFMLVEALLAQPRFSATVIAGQGVKGDPQSGEAVFIWAALEPLLETLAIPLNLRSRKAGAMKSAELTRAWSTFDDLATSLGLDDDAVQIFRSNSAWTNASPQDHAERRRRLGEALRSHADATLGRRYRAHLLRALIERYYAKAKKKRPTRAQAITRAYERPLTALFAGDWLAFLDYLGEQPAEGEVMITALADPKPLVGDEAQAPMKERERALRRLWEALDDLYARQEPAMLPPSRYPLEEDWSDDSTDDGDSDLDFSWESRTFLEELRDVTLAGEQLRAGSTAVRLPSDVVHEVEELWRTKTIERYPNAIVTNLQPWAEAQRTFGPALGFWQGLLFSLWSNFEEDYDERTVGALAAQFRQERRQLAALGFPIDDCLFERLIELEDTLPPPQDVVLSEGPSHAVMGIELRVVMTSGRRRSGFAEMRDLVTEYRRAWANEHLDAYLVRLWKDTLRDAAEAINRHRAVKRKAPTVRQLAGIAADAANCWCGGRIELLCAAIAEEEALGQAYNPKVPPNRRAFLLRLFSLLGGALIPKIDYARDDAKSQHAKQRAADRQRGIGELTIDALRVLQLEEALGTTPTLKQFGTGAFQRYASRVWETGSIDEQWDRYLATVGQALSTEAVPAISLKPRTSRPSVTLREVEREPRPTATLGVAVSPPASMHEQHGLLGRVFDHGASGERTAQPLESPPGYVLQSEGPSDVVGESYYQEALEATRAMLRYDREIGRPVFDAVLVPEPDNPYDSKAVAVYSPAGKIGHVPRGSLWFELLSSLADAGHSRATCRAWLIGGEEGKFLGAVLGADPDEELTLVAG